MVEFNFVYAVTHDLLGVCKCTILEMIHGLNVWFSGNINLMCTCMISSPPWSPSLSPSQPPPSVSSVWDQLSNKQTNKHWSTEVLKLINKSFFFSNTNETPQEMLYKKITVKTFLKCISDFPIVTYDDQGLSCRKACTFSCSRTFLALEVCIAVSGWLIKQSNSAKWENTEIHMIEKTLATYILLGVTRYSKAMTLT